MKKKRSNCEGFKRRLVSFDSQGQSIGFNFDGSETYQTVLGSLITLLTIAVAIVYGQERVRTMITYGDSKFQLQINITDSEHQINVFQNGTSLGLDWGFGFSA